MESRRLMDQYPTFTEFLETKESFVEFKARINGNNKRGKMVESKFKVNISKVKKQKHYIVPEFPKHWEKQFEDARSNIESSIEYVNEQIENGFNILPPNKVLFRPFTFCPPEDIKGIILGQDPYPQDGVANGLAFSCNNTMQPFIKNVFKELERTHKECPISGNLDFWAEQGVLLVNTCLTVNEGKPKSHGNAWKETMISLLNSFFELGTKVFLCVWGLEAKNFAKNLNLTRNVKVIEAGHPSSNNSSNPFVGSKVFKKIDKFLEKNNIKPINWIERPDESETEETKTKKKKKSKTHEASDASEDKSDSETEDKKKKSKNHDESETEDKEKRKKKSKKQDTSDSGTEEKETRKKKKSKKQNETESDSEDAEDKKKKKSKKQENSNHSDTEEKAINSENEKEVKKEKKTKKAIASDDETESEKKEKKAKRRIAEESDEEN